MLIVQKREKLERTLRVQVLPSVKLRDPPCLPSIPSTHSHAHTHVRAHTHAHTRTHTHTGAHRPPGAAGNPCLFRLLTLLSRCRRTLGPHGSLARGCSHVQQRQPLPLQARVEQILSSLGEKL